MIGGTQQGVLVSSGCVDRVIRTILIPSPSRCESVCIVAAVVVVVVVVVELTVHSP